MESRAKTLIDLRQEIDSIDNSIHELIMRRTKVIEGVCEVKRNSAIKIRPSREAMILYRLCSMHRGQFPKRELCRIWRELIVATLSFEGPFSVAVYHPEEMPGYWDLARDHYGTFTPIQRHTSLRATVESVREQKTTVGILPFPSRDQKDPWWRFLISDKPETPKIIARLPFIPGASSHDISLDALVICPVPYEETGRDCSFFAIESETDIGHPAIERALSQAGFSALFHQLWHDPNRPPGWTYLVEISGFIDPDGPTIPKLLDTFDGRIARIIQLGGYGTPLNENDLKPSENPIIYEKIEDK